MIIINIDQKFFSYTELHREFTESHSAVSLCNSVSPLCFSVKQKFNLEIQLLKDIPGCLIKVHILPLSLLL